ncbi:hypothetical protein V6N13_033065 [Hibiscus sabdariffa]
MVQASPVSSYSKKSKDGVISLFVENIPDGMNWKGLWFTFARHADIDSVYIAKKLSRGGKKFGFVRMKNRVDADRVIERLHGFRLYGKVLTIKMANVFKAEGKSVAGKKSASSTEFGTGYNKVRETGEANNVDIQQPTNLKRRCITGHVENEDLWKMRRCLVGETSTVCSVNSILDRLARWGMSDIRVQRLGAKAFLLTIENEDLFIMLEDLDWSYLKEVFCNINPWSEKANYNERATWLEIRGLPIHGWNHVTIKRIAELWGSFESLGENYNHSLDCEKVTVLISTGLARRVEEVIELVIGEDSFVIFVRELGFSDDSYPLCQGFGSNKKVKDEPHISGCWSDSDSDSKTVGVVRSNVDSELDAINAMCADKDYNNCSSRELSPVRSNIYEVNLVGENPKLRNTSVSPILMEDGVSYRDALVSIPAVVATPTAITIEGLVVGPDPKNRSLEQVELEAVKKPCEIGPGEGSVSWADAVDRDVNKGKVCSAKKVKVSCNLGENEVDLYAEFEDRKKGARVNEGWWWLDPNRCLFGVDREVLLRSPLLNHNVHFRICGVAVNSRPACGGVLFGKNGEIRALFSGPASGNNRFSAGLFAVKMAVEIFISLGWAREVPLVICLECRIIHCWLENPMLYSWGLAKEIVEIMCLLRNLPDYRLQLIDREVNVLASSLAREGIGNGSQVIVPALFKSFDGSIAVQGLFSAFLMSF